MLPCAVQGVVRTFLHCTLPLRAQSDTSGFLRAALRAVHGEQAGKLRDEIRVFPVGALCVWNAHYALVSSLTYTHTHSLFHTHTLTGAPQSFYLFFLLLTRTFIPLGFSCTIPKPFILICLELLPKLNHIFSSHIELPPSPLSFLRHTHKHTHKYTPTHPPTHTHKHKHT